MAKSAPKSQDAYLHDMLEAARLIHGYMAGVSFDESLDQTLYPLALRRSIEAQPTSNVIHP